MKFYIVPEDELMHYGVKGMKWHHRKARTTKNASKNFKSSKLDNSFDDFDREARRMETEFNVRSNAQRAGASSFNNAASGVYRITHPKFSALNDMINKVVKKHYKKADNWKKTKSKINKLLNKKMR